MEGNIKSTLARVFSRVCMVKLIWFFPKFVTEPMGLISP